ncbi:diaminopropionate ammonia-lyase [Klebsiella grimontii]|uniref:Diaminopropionate ammonia-lyase n=1 Tax=Klebsiella grimontii TaxID=2058152 RepID=A0A7H4P1T7_9ENTR|nr:diaminopropionate ammonia-lyase [Klebsiella grimontii]
MPKGSAQERVDAILRLGAECIVTDMNYDDTVRFTMQTAQNNGWRWCRTLPGKATQKFRPGLCRATPPSPMKR